MYENVVENVLYLGYKMLLLFFILNGFVGFKKTKPAHHSCNPPPFTGPLPDMIFFPCITDHREATLQRCEMRGGRAITDRETDAKLLFGAFPQNHILCQYLF